MTAWLLLGGALLLAFVNGANDNMKATATLFGSGALGYRTALALATISTAAGSLACYAVSPGLVRAFSGKGLVPDAELSPEMLTAAALAAAATVLAATLLGLPISTTHALIGGLVGAGLVAAGSRLNLSALGSVFLLPLLASPIAAVALAAGLYLTGRAARRRAGIEADTCVCVGEEWVSIGSAAAVERALGARTGTMTECRRRYAGSFAGVSAQAIATVSHSASACLVGMARGFNDTPKILGLIVGAALMTPGPGALALSVAMAAGGVLAGRRVAETLGRGITSLNEGQGLAGNLATSILVVGASRAGLPVSTTHVSTGGIFGVGAVVGEVRWRMMSAILLAWGATLPAAGLLGAGIMWVLS